LARLTGLDEATIRAGVALLLAGLIEAGSALGFTLVSASTALNPPRPVAGRVPSPQKVSGRDPNPAPKPPAQPFERWVRTQLKQIPPRRFPRARPTPSSAVGHTQQVSPPARRRASDDS
jgi:hypothetical protein